MSSGEDVRFQVGRVVAAGFGVHDPPHDVLVVALGEAAHAGEVAGETRDAEVDRGGLGVVGARASS
jgi:hypothetical protein